MSSRAPPPPPRPRLPLQRMVEEGEVVRGAVVVAVLASRPVTLPACHTPAQDSPLRQLLAAATMTMTWTPTKPPRWLLQRRRPQ